MNTEHLSRFEHALKAMRASGSKWKRSGWPADSAFVHVVNGRLDIIAGGNRSAWNAGYSDLLERDWMLAPMSDAEPLYTFPASDFFSFDSRVARRWVEAAHRSRLEWLQQHVEKYVRGGWKTADIWIEEHPGNRTMLFVGGHMRAQWQVKAEPRAA